MEGPTGFVVIHLLIVACAAVVENPSASILNDDTTIFTNEQIGILKAKIVQFQNLKDFIAKSTFLENWKGQCPSRIDKRVVKCSNQNGTSCICWSIGQIKTNWIKANAFCDYYGMNLISFSNQSIYQDMMVIRNVTSDDNGPFWTSGQDSITRSVWVFQNGELLSKKEHYKPRSLNGLEPPPKELDKTSCINVSLAGNATELFKFTPTNCFDEFPFICHRQRQ